MKKKIWSIFSIHIWSDVLSDCEWENVSKYMYKTKKCWKTINNITKYVTYLTIFVNAYCLLHNESHSSWFSLIVSYILRFFWHISYKILSFTSRILYITWFMQYVIYLTIFSFTSRIFLCILVCPQMWNSMEQT